MKNVPEIRFKGFTDAWVQRRFGEVSTSFSGGTPSVGNSKYYGGEIPFIRSAEINSDSTELFLSEQGLKNSSAKMVQKGDILYALYGATSGEIGISKIRGAINQAILAIKPNEAHDTQFIAQWLRLNKLNIIEKYLQGGQGNLSAAIVKDLYIDFPDKTEQTAIGNFFRTLDSAIALLKRTLIGFKKLKKAYLQQMFPQEGETVPKVRFEGFRGGWEVRKLGDVVEKLKSYPLSRDAETNEVTGYRYIHYGDIHKQIADVVVSDEQLPCIKEGNYTSIEKGDLLLADASEDYVGIAKPCIIMHKPKDKIIAGLHTIAIRPLNTYPLFLYFLFHTDGFKKFGGFIGTGLKVFGITYDNLARYEMALPNFEEQTVISSFFCNLDKQITSQQTKLDNLKKIKSIYLQKMFV